MHVKVGMKHYIQKKLEVVAQSLRPLALRMIKEEAGIHSQVDQQRKKKSAEDVYVQSLKISTSS